MYTIWHKHPLMLFCPRRTCATTVIRAQPCTDSDACYYSNNLPPHRLCTLAHIRRHHQHLARFRATHCSSSSSPPPPRGSNNSIPLSTGYFLRRKYDGGKENGAHPISDPKSSDTPLLFFHPLQLQSHRHARASNIRR